MTEDYVLPRAHLGRTPETSIEGISRFVQPVLIVIAFALCVLVFGIVQAPLPSNMLDSSWAYAVDYASTHIIPFGTDLAFPYGPLGFMSSRFMLPDHQWLFLALSLCCIAVFFWSCYAYMPKIGRYGLLILPFILANIDLSNAFFFTFPLISVYLAAKDGGDQPLALAVNAILVALLGLTPLIKGTMCVPTIVCVGLTTIILLQKGHREAVFLPCITLASTVATWLCLGQPLGSIGPYFLHQIWIASGYTDAMASFGDPREVRTFLICAGILMATFVIRRRRFDLMKALASACVLFVSFKAGFVRHDAHALISASGLALVAFVSVMDRPTILRCIAGLACMAGAVSIERAYGPVDLTSHWERMTSSIRESVRATTTLLQEPGQFRADFERAKQAIADQYKLPATRGSVDLYSYDQTMILASDRDYDPRPVIQSYSAFTADLAALNEDHLRGDRAPQTVFFSVTPIDERYPALEDGRSWPALLSRYKARSFVTPGGADEFAVLERTDDAAMALIDAPAVSGTFRFDEDIPIRQDMPLVWATLHFKPTLLGRLDSVLWKLPLLKMEVTYQDGRTARFRMIAGMSSAGFLLSPTISTARDFVSLRSNTDVLADNKVISIKLHQDSSHALWGDSFRLELARFHVPPDHDVDALYEGTLDPGPPIGSLTQGGDCIIETLDHRVIDKVPMNIHGGAVAVKGWAMISSTTGTASGRLRLALTPSDGGATSYAEAVRFPRPDVDTYFGLRHPTNAGFSAQIDLKSLRGRYDLKVVQDGPSGSVVCSGNEAVIER